MFTLTTGVAACTLALEPSEEQCDSAKDCDERGFAGASCVDHVCVGAQGTGGQGTGGTGGQGGEVDPRWACLGNLQEPTPTPGATHTYRQQIVALVTQAPPPGLAVRMCANADVDCTTPIVDPVSVDAQGFINVTVDSGFDGYFEVTSDASMDALVFMGRKIVADTEVQRPVQVLSEALFNSVADKAAVVPDPARGHALIGMTDCDFQRAPGISVSHDSADPSVVPFYLFGQQPDLVATASDEDGSAGVANLPAAFVSFSSTLESTGQPIGRARVSIRAGWLTYVTLVPGP